MKHFVPTVETDIGIRADQLLHIY